MCSTSLWLAFVASVLQLRESSRLCLCSAQQHGYTLPHLLECTGSQIGFCNKHENMKMEQWSQVTALAGLGVVVI